MDNNKRITRKPLTPEELEQVKIISEKTLAHALETKEKYSGLIGKTEEEAASLIESPKFLFVYSRDRFLTFDPKNFGGDANRVNVRVKEGKVFEILGVY